MPIQICGQSGSDDLCRSVTIVINGWPPLISLNALFPRYLVEWHFWLISYTDVAPFGTTIYLFFKWANPGLFLFIFVLFTFQFKWQIYNLNNINWNKHRWCAWDSNPGWQDGRRRKIHWAIAAPPSTALLIMVRFWFTILATLCFCTYLNQNSPPL